VNSYRPVQICRTRCRVTPTSSAISWQFAPRSVADTIAISRGTPFAISARIRAIATRARRCFSRRFASAAARTARCFWM